MEYLSISLIVGWKMDWREIKDSQHDKRFYFRGRPVFKTFRSILKFHEPGLAPVEDESGWYHITANGTELYPDRYERTFGFYCGLAAVTSKEGCFHIDAAGKPLYGERYAWCGNFQENICPVRDKERVYFHIDSNGKRICPQAFLYAGDFRDGIACVKCSDGKWRHIKADGQFLNGKGFLDLGVFHKNIAPVRDARGWFHSDMDGNPLYEERYLFIEPFYNGCALVTCFDWSKKVIDEHGGAVVCV